MFTGIIQAAGRVLDVVDARGGLRLKVTAPKTWKVKAGDSIAVNGVCSTVVKTGGGLTFEYMPESLERTNIAQLAKEDMVNLERSLRATDRLDGHIVQGHIDTTAELIHAVPEGNSNILTLRFSKRDLPNMRLIAEKGSIAIEGISLTVAKISAAELKVKIIPYTWEHTNLRHKKIGTQLNIEFDVLAKYLARLNK